MNTLSLKEKALAAVAAVVALYVALGVYGYFQFSDRTSRWSKAARDYDKACRQYAEEERLISEKAKWNAAYEDEKAAMPMFAEGKATDTTWLEKMDALAQKHNIYISQRQAGKEIEAGDVLELEIDVRNWEGALESLVRFLHELENTDEGMFDVKSLSLKPSTKKGYLKGSFTLTCAYMRER